MVKLAGALFLVQSNDGGHHGEVLAESLVIVFDDELCHEPELLVVATQNGRFEDEGPDRNRDRLVWGEGGRLYLDPLHQLRAGQAYQHRHQE